MQSQLNYMIAQQHNAELMQRADRARLIADIQTQRPKSRRPTVLARIRARTASPRPTLTQSATRHTA